MIGSAHRFHGYNSLRPVYQHGHTARGPLLIVRYRRNDRPGGYRAAVVVSRKVHKSAVARNRIRRRIYAALQRHEANFTAPHDLILTVLSEELATMPAAELETVLQRQLEKAGIIQHGKTTSAHGIVEKVQKESD